MAATNERNDQNHEIVGALNIIEDIISRLDSLGDPDYVEGMAIRFDVLKRYLVNIRIDDIMHFGIAGQGSPKFNNLSRRKRYFAMNNSAFPAQTYTACRGKRSYDIHEGQLNFLLEQDFGKVSEVSSMMGDAKELWSGE